MIAVKRQAELLEVIQTLRAATRLAGRLNRGEKHCNKQRDDRDCDENLDECKPASLIVRDLSPHPTPPLGFNQTFGRPASVRSIDH